MKVKILIGVICFIVGAGAYYLYENNFNHFVKLEKCADKRFVKFYEKKLKPENVQKVYKATLKKKLSIKEYEEMYVSCIKLAKNLPDLFSKQY